jgi:hypothetical protein
MRNLSLLLTLTLFALTGCTDPGSIDLGDDDSLAGDDDASPTPEPTPSPTPEPTPTPTPEPTPATDADNDGVVAADDCDDNDPNAYPGAPETACDGVDQDCDGADFTAVDADMDGHAPPECGGDDCDDDDPVTFTGAAEQCDGVDNNCDLWPGTTERDDDGDGWMVCEADCNDDPFANGIDQNPGLTEICDGIDNDCDGAAPDEVDADNDGWMICEGDCDDDRWESHPDIGTVWPEWLIVHQCLSFNFAPYTDLDCNGVDDRDNNQDGVLDCTYPDNDGDDWVNYPFGPGLNLDCDDNDPSVNYVADEAGGQCQ